MRSSVVVMHVTEATDSSLQVGALRNLRREWQKYESVLLLNMTRGLEKSWWFLRRISDSLPGSVGVLIAARVGPGWSWMTEQLLRRCSQFRSMVLKTHSVNFFSLAAEFWDSSWSLWLSSQSRLIWAWSFSFSSRSCTDGTSDITNVSGSQTLLVFVKNNKSK